MPLSLGSRAIASSPSPTRVANWPSIGRRSSTTRAAGLVWSPLITATSRWWEIRLASSHSFWKRSEASARRAARSATSLSAPAIAGATGLACLGRASRTRSTAVGPENS